MAVEEHPAFAPSDHVGKDRAVHARRGDAAKREAQAVRRFGCRRIGVGAEIDPGRCGPEIGVAIERQHAARPGRRGAGVDHDRRRERRREGVASAGRGAGRPGEGPASGERLLKDRRYALRDYQAGRHRQGEICGAAIRINAQRENRAWVAIDHRHPRWIYFALAAPPLPPSQRDGDADIPGFRTAIKRR